MGTVHNQSQAATEGQCTHENSLIIQDNIMTPVDPIQIDSVPEIETAESRNSTPENETVESGNTQGLNNTNDCLPKEQLNNSLKTKPKKLNKNQSKAKKDEIVVDKTYILDIESQINELKSTLDLYKRSTANSDNQGNHNPQTVHSNPSGTKECESGCRHRCCDELKDKIQENRLRSLEFQMLQSMNINKAMHIQLVAQMRSICYGHASGPAYNMIPMGPLHGTFVQDQSNMFGLSNPNQIYAPNYAQSFNPGYQNPYYLARPQVQAHSAQIGPFMFGHPQNGHQMQPGNIPLRPPTYPSQFPMHQPVTVHPACAVGTPQIGVPYQPNQQTHSRDWRQYPERIHATRNTIPDNRETTDHVNNTQRQRKDYEPSARQHRPNAKDSNSEQSSAENLNRKRHLSYEQNCRADRSNSEGKKLCEKLETEPQNKLDTHNGHNPDILGSQRKNQQTELGKKTEIPTVEIPKEPIYVSDSPRKDKVSNGTDETTKSQDRDHF